MSELNNLPNLTEGLMIGQPIRECHGTVCCPAIASENEKQYMVKSITIPASQIKADALLLTGAYSSKEDVAEYFAQLASETQQQIILLEKFSQDSNFTAYAAHSVEPLENEIGYCITLISPYRTTLAQVMTENNWTQSQAMRLALDICAALSHCRQAGFLYTDLKPENVIMDQDGSFRIADIGFVSLDSLAYSSLPESYRCSYTAPEVMDAYAALSTSMDVYALGLILYAIYNGNVLPGQDRTPAQYADYELWQIIEKACSANPDARWQTPDALAYELTSYIQRNGISDDPVIPPVIQEEQPQEHKTRFLTEEENEASLATLLAIVPDEEPERIGMEALLEEESAENLEDLDAMLAQADELISHEAPQPVVAPAVIDVQLPAEPVEEEVPQEDAAFDIPDQTEAEDSGEELIVPAEPEIDEAEPKTEPVQEESDDAAPASKKKKKAGGWIAAICVILLLLAGGIFYYNMIYTQHIDNITVDSQDGRVNVLLDCDVRDELLTVVCTDTYGNTLRAPVSNGNATISGLNPNTHYRLEVKISGMHRLVGKTTASFTTSSLTQIMNLSAICGKLDGSAILNFSVVGNSPDEWELTYVASGEKTKTLFFSGTSVTVNDLTVGKNYTFTLAAKSNMPLAGNTEIQFTAQKVVVAQDLQVVTNPQGGITVQWALPADTDQQTWIVRVYNTDGYDKTLETTDLSAAFSDIDISLGCTVLLNASGMSKGLTLTVDPNTTTVTDIQVSPTADGYLNIDWNVQGPEAQGNWVLTYQIASGETQQLICVETSAKLPNFPGLTYMIQVTLEDNSPLITMPFTYTSPEAVEFAGYYITGSMIQKYMCKTPSKDNWTHTDLKNSDFTSKFNAEEKASFMLYLNANYANSTDEIITAMIIRDAQGNPILLSTSVRTWNKIWTKRYAGLDIPQLPDVSGEYTVEVYFNGMFIFTQEFTIR